MSVRWRIVLAMLLLSFGIVVLMGVLSVRLSDQILGNRAEEFMSAIVDRSAFELNQQILSSENEVDSVYQDFLSSFEPDRPASDPGYLDKYLGKITPSVELAAELNPSKTAYLVIFDPRDPSVVVGSIYYSDTDRDGTPHSADVRPVLQRLGKLHPGPPASKFWVSETDNRIIDCFTVVPGPRGPSALVGVGVDKELVKGQIRRTNYLSSGFLFLTDQDCRVIYHPRVGEGNLLEISAAPDSAPPETGGGIRFSKQTDQDKNEVLFGQLKLKNGWHLGLQVKTVDIREGLDSMVGIILSVMALAMIGAVFVGLMAGNQISRPYVYLAKEIGKIGSGNYEIELMAEYLTRSDEAGALTRAIDQMVRRQKESFEQIQSYNQNLEKVIDARTAELVRANESLEESLSRTEESNRKLELSLETIEQTQKKLATTERIASLTYLVGGIAHQMNTPMGNALTSVSFLQDELERVQAKVDQGALDRDALDSSLEAARLSSGLILRSLEKSIQLIEQFKGIAPGRMEGFKGAQNVRQVLEHQISRTAEKYSQVTCRFKVQVPEGLEFYCNVDNLTNLFRELLENSFTHGFKGVDDPLITVRAEGLSDPVEGLSIFYADNGTGITADQSNKLFTPFYTTRMGQEHSGLGLNMVYNLILGVFNGEIQVDDTAETGLAFKMHLIQEPRPIDG